MENLMLSSSIKLSSPFQNEARYTWGTVRLPKRGVPVHHRTNLAPHQRVAFPSKLDFHKDQDNLIGRRKGHMEKVRIMLSQSVLKSKAIYMVDALKKLGIDHHFGEEISTILDSTYQDMCKIHNKSDENMIDIALQFKLLREAGYNISSDVFWRFMDEKGKFKQSLCSNIQGLMTLHEASFLNMGEEILYKANEFSTKHLKSSMKYLGPYATSLVRHTLEHPHHMSLKQYKAKKYLTLLSLRRNNAPDSMEELAKIEFDLSQQLYQDEFIKLTRWWKDLDLAKELPFARDQVLKWYLWPMTAFPGLQFSKHRLEITKAISFVYLIDDIFDNMGTPEELALFTQTINSWKDSSQLPRYMRACFVALQQVTSGIARFVQKEYGWNPTSFLRKLWAELCNAFLVEAKWFANKQTPSADDYLTNGVVSSGVPLVLDIFFILLGHRITDETTHLITRESPFVSCPAKILRLWDDLGSAKDENQEGFDGSYVEFYMNDNLGCSLDIARAHTKDLISKSWEEMNKAYFVNTSLSSYFAEASMNCMRMVRVMYNYDEEQKLPMMNDYIQNLLFEETNKTTIIPANV